jgi:hypothetical protein
MLEKHGQDDYEVTAKKHYPFRYTLPKIKGMFSFIHWHYMTQTHAGECRQCIADAIDVDNIADYKEMVVKINESKPAVIKILVDMRDIQKLPQAYSSSEGTALEVSPKTVRIFFIQYMICETNYCLG